jgi:hypothetical protein
VGWHGADPLLRRRLATVSPEDIADVGARIAAIRGSAAAAGGDADNSKKRAAPGSDLVVWAEAADAPAAVPELIRPYQEAGATWWIESARPGDGWWEGVQRRVAAGR